MILANRLRGIKRRNPQRCPTEALLAVHAAVPARQDSQSLLVNGSEHGSADWGTSFKLTSRPLADFVVPGSARDF
jgi:hypothetical protein